MPGTPTTNYRWPTPASTDLLRDGAAAITAVAAAADRDLKAVADGSVPRSAPAGGVVASGKYTFGGVQLESNGVTVVAAKSADAPHFQAYNDPRIRMISSAGGLLGGYAYCLVQYVNATPPPGLTSEEHSRAAVNWFSMISWAQPKPVSSAAVKQVDGPVDPELFDGLSPVRFRYTEAVPGAAVGDRRLGFVAEDVESAGVPVDRSGELPALHPVDLTAVLWAKVQQLEERVSQLEGGV